MDLIGGAKVILVCPTPRYIKGKCCSEPGHVENFDGAGFLDDIGDCQEQHMRLLGGWGANMGINYDILDTTAVVFPMDPSLRERKTSQGSSIWCDNDSVHLSRGAYMDVADAIQEMAAGDGDEDTTDGTAVGSTNGSTSGSVKRRQPDSVVTLPYRPPLTKRGCAGKLPTAAGWLRGVPATSPRRGACLLYTSPSPRDS